MEKSKKENISIGKISELLKNAPTDDGTFYGITLEELEKEREALYENYSRNFG